MSALETLINAADRETVLAMLGDESVTLVTLRRCACFALGGNLDTLMALEAPEGAAPAPAQPPKAAAPKPNGAPKTAPKPAAPTGDSASLAEIDTVINAWRDSGHGFAFSDIKSAVPTARDNSIRGRIKTALAEGRIKSAGEKRFMRYGKTEAAARKRSESDRAGAGAPGASV